MKIGYAFTGSFCTFSKSIEALKGLVKAGYDVYPIMSETAYSTDTRFGDAKDFQNEIINITGNSIIHTINQAEPIGPKKLFDVHSSVHGKHACKACNRHCRHLCYNGGKKPFAQFKARYYRRFNKRRARSSRKEYRQSVEL